MTSPFSGPLVGHPVEISEGIDPEISDEQGAIA
jgi:hypothetical protein